MRKWTVGRSLAVKGQVEERVIYLRRGMPDHVSML